MTDDPDRALSGEVLTPDGQPVPAEGLAATVADLTDDELAPAERRRLLGRLAGQAGRTGWRLLSRPRGALRWVADTVVEVAPHVPIRDLDTLRRHYHGLDGEALAERLVRNASRATAAVGAAGGGLSAVEWTAPPTLLSTPVLLSAETVAVVAIELKLIGELHEVYRVPVPGSGPARAVGLVNAWAGRRGITLASAGRGLGASLGLAARKELRDRLLRRFGRNLTTLGPLLTGAAVGAELNRRATRAVGTEIRRDLAHRVRRGGPPPGWAPRQQAPGWVPPRPGSPPRAGGPPPPGWTPPSGGPPPGWTPPPGGPPPGWGPPPGGPPPPGWRPPPGGAPGAGPRPGGPQPPPGWSPPSGPSRE